MPNSNKRLSHLTVFLFALPMLVGGAMHMLAGTFFMKYATDTLLLTPAFVGTALFVSRLWDAVNDPFIGWLNDRSVKKGKRAQWILVSSLPISLFFYLLWFPPVGFEKAFVIVCLLLFFTAFTALFVPHYSLAADITYNQHDRNRLFGMRAMFEYLGTFAGVGVMFYLSTVIDVKEKAHLPMGIILLTTLLIAILVYLKFSHVESRFQANVRIFDFAKHFLKNNHAWLVLSAGLFSQLGASFVFTLTLYFSEYVLQDKESANFIIGIFLLTAMSSIPLWVALLKKFEKKQIWIAANSVISLSFISTFWLQAEMMWSIYAVSGVAGFFAGAILLIHPSALADVIDYDEMLHKKNNAATYFSLFTLVNKSAMGFAAIFIGSLLHLGGYHANQAQTQTTLNVIRWSYAFLPTIIFSLASLILLFYKLDKNTHEKIKQQLKAVES